MTSHAPGSIVQFLKRSSFLGRLPEEVLGQIVRKGQVKSFARRQLVYRQGDSGDSALIVLRGSLKVTTTTSDGREIGHNFLGVGDLVGEIALLDGGTRTATVTALEETEALSISRRDLMPVLIEHPKACLEVMEAVCRKLRIATARAEDQTHGMMARLARGLVRLAEQHGEPQEDAIRIDFKGSQTELGEYVSLARTNVSRLIARLKDLGIVVPDRSGITITDMKRLVEYANTAEPSN